MAWRSPEFESKKFPCNIYCTSLFYPLNQRYQFRHATGYPDPTFQERNSGRAANSHTVSTSSNIHHESVRPQGPLTTASSPTPSLYQARCLHYLLASLRHKIVLLSAYLNTRHLAMENSPLRRLPSELRNQIYELSLTSSAGITVKCTENGHFKEATVSTPNISLTRTCREIRKVTIRMYYFVNTFNILASTAAHRDDVPNDEFPCRAARINMIFYKRCFSSYMSDVSHVNLKLRCSSHYTFSERGSQSVRDVSRQQIHDVRALFDKSARFEVHFEVRDTLRDGLDQVRCPEKVLNVVWDVDQPVEQFLERLTAEKRKMISEVGSFPSALSLPVQALVTGEDRFSWW